MPDGEGHLLTSASTRSGKGTCQIIRNLLGWTGSVFVLDIKGENHFRSAGCRSKVMQQKVYRFAPFESNTFVFNPILFIRTSLSNEPTAEELATEELDVLDLAKLLIVPNKKTNEPIWDETANSVLIAFVLYVRTAKLYRKGSASKVRERSMREVRRLLTLGEEDFIVLLDDMSKSKRPLIREQATELKGNLLGNDRFFLSLKATVSHHTAIWSLTAIHRATYKPSTTPGDLEPAPNDFDFSEMRSGKVSFYLVIPPQKISKCQPLLRVITGIALIQLQNSHELLSEQDTDTPPVLFLLDEFPQLGHMQVIEENLAFIAGYGVRLWFFIQDLGQLYTAYGDSSRTILANTEYKSFFGIVDIETAAYVSRYLGEMPIDTYSYNNGRTEGSANWNSNDAQNKSYSVSTSTIFRPLLSPDQVLCLPRNKQIILIKGLRAILCDLIRYCDIDDLKQKSRIPPQS
ncbi:type IV secretory system conjugative DNA transfer family protein [Methylomonas koyamae]|uniref:type IV secretory system conjugative DNA transfer family protein n=1 Tax=Methylomonas koyamae TaxID=702114 RepID=UPI002872F21A|nr:type IV secretory system conjugative DNA transfer family protein [Methylomonas koyamae]WNB74576.1 type IV secretory system conjugative DNA transfer family protein [Methylomonas koyamae]